MKKSLALASLFIVLLSGCLKKVDIKDFDKEAWAKDPDGCLNIRSEMTDKINEIKKNILGLYQKDIIKVFGPPAEQELYKRSQTYYIYYIDPATSCAIQVDNPRKLYVRFTSLGIANEVNIR